MKTYIVFFILIINLFSFTCLGQRSNNANKNTPSQSNDTLKEHLVIVGYYVEETINMPFGQRITKYEVSKLSMVNTYDLGPNNTRIVTPIYRKPKIKPAEINPLQSKAISSDNVNNINVPVKIKTSVSAKKEIKTPASIEDEVNTSSTSSAAKEESPKYVVVDVVNTYAKVINKDKNYKSIDTNVLKKVADRSYFEGDLVSAAKYYSQLFAITKNLDAMYYYRYAQALNAINKTKEANEMMKIFNNNSKP